MVEVAAIIPGWSMQPIENPALKKVARVMGEKIEACRGLYLGEMFTLFCGGKLAQ